MFTTYLAHMLIPWLLTVAVIAALMSCHRRHQMTKAQAKRRSEIVRALSDLSRNGWANALPCDYEPLERELRIIEAA
jgi:hypothetical protein